MDPIRTGKVKDVYDNGDSLLFKFSDRISVFDKIIPVTVPDKGADGKRKRILFQMRKVYLSGTMEAQTPAIPWLPTGANSSFTYFLQVH